ncbi:hybrid sensor histidine kinase/response regulator transcription factor [Robertkochia solimangrovi]|uniref:hybrid sensor histidine kinase/response regulator transcription factor n=1 Tax=Robertkochia solimangrovi TaxID=2213046 RepID=UPI00117FB885|nr:two-component regulator propeller domain-containing protein [Robertkochia solimangrovi]TRZ45081.1 hybrid sensor histidine kinase/response regulator [Robertkochia solimangrovi]
MIKRSSLIFCFLISFMLQAQIESPKFSFVSVNDDMPKAGIYSINQDDYGFIWMSTNGSGLFRYDGMEYKGYNHVLNDTSSLKSSVVYTTFLDSKQRLWVGTENGLNLYDRDNDHFIDIPNGNFGDYLNDYIAIKSITESTTGKLLVGTYDNGMFMVDPDNFSVKPVKTITAEPFDRVNVLALTRDETGKIYAATTLGLMEFDPKTNSIQHSVFGDKKITEALESLKFDPSGNLWLGSYRAGLIKIAAETDSRKFGEKIMVSPISDHPIFSILPLENGGLLCGTENDGLYHINTDGAVIHHYVTSKRNEKSLLSNSIWSLFRDKDEKIWLGYYNKGVAIHDELYDKFQDIESLYNNTNSLQSGSVKSIVQDKEGRFWIAMDGGGIDVVDLATNEFQHINSSDKHSYQGLTSDYIQSLCIDKKGNIWAGSWDNGLYFLKKGSRKFINYNTENTNNALSSNTIVSLAEDTEGTIWIGTFNNGVCSITPTDHKITNHNEAIFEQNHISSSNIWKILTDQKNNIWIGTTKGLYKIRKLTGEEFEVTSLNRKLSEKFGNQITANHVLSLFESRDHAIWVGTKGAGMCRVDPKTGEITWYNRQNGLIFDNICSIIESKNGNIWFSGNAGIAKLDMSNGSFSHYTKNDGLICNDFNLNAVFECSNGNIYFGNYQGVDYFDPDRIPVNKNENSLYLTEFKLFNTKVSPFQKNSPLQKVITVTDSISLNASQSVFTIEYSGINFTRPEENEFAYYLEGYENSWNYVGNVRNATYTNLDPGNYTFKLKSSNNDGVWNENPLELKITVLPPWWKTNLALLAYLLLFICGVILLNKLTQSRIREKQLAENERAKRAQENELNEKKFQFFTNISHEFRTPLTLIMNPLEDLLNNEDMSLSQRIREKHKIIYKNTYRLHRLINELLDFRKLEYRKLRVKARQFNLRALASDVTEHFKDEAYTRNIHLGLITNTQDLRIWGDENMIEKIMFNLLSNAFKFTPDGGKINIELFAKDDLCAFPGVAPGFVSKSVEITISDTGPGIAKEEIDKMFERFYQIESLNKNYYGGTGIGLEVVRSFVELHKGEIKVESELGQGTTIKISIPAGKDHFSEEEIITEISEQTNQRKTIPGTGISETMEAQKAATIANCSRTLLIVEDNADLRNYLKNELKEQYKIITAKNGKEGLDLANENQPDVILTDVLMPEMNGFEFCKQVKSDIRTSHIPILMLTAKATINDRIEGIEIGADAYMVKPFNLKLLKLRISQLITSRQLIFNKYFSIISDLPQDMQTNSLDKEFIEKVFFYINENISDPDISVESLANKLNLSRSQVYRKIKSLTDQSPNEFIRNVRLQKARQILESGNTNIGNVCYAVGFASPSYFSKCFKQNFGILPTEVQPVKI